MLCFALPEGTGMPEGLLLIFPKAWLPGGTVQAGHLRVCVLEQNALEGQVKSLCMRVRVRAAHMHVRTRARVYACAKHTYPTLPECASLHLETILNDHVTRHVCGLESISSLELVVARRCAGHTPRDDNNISY